MKVINKFLVSVAWIAIIGLSLYFFFDNVVAYLYGFRSKIFGDTFFNNQFWVVAHLVGGSISLFTGPIQFWKTLRLKHNSFHKVVGKIYIAAAFITGLSALRLSFVSLCIPCRTSLFLLSLFMLLSTACALSAIRKQKIRSHQQFMIRSYVLILSFVAVRLDQLIPLTFLFGTIDDPVFKRTVTEYFFSFVPLIFTEVMMTWLPLLRKKPTMDFIRS